MRGVSLKFCGATDRDHGSGVLMNASMRLDRAGERASMEVHGDDLHRSSTPASGTGLSRRGSEARRGAPKGDGRRSPGTWRARAGQRRHC